jgi:hypothetical protein
MMERPSPVGQHRVWWALQLIYALCVLGLVLLPGHRYEWMRELGPAFDGALPDDGSGDRWVAIAVLLVGALVAQLLSAWFAGTPRRRWLALALGGLCIAVTVRRFGLP